MWLTPGRASGCKNSAPILFINTPEKRNVMKRKSNPIRKQTINQLYIYIYICDLREFHINVDSCEIGIEDTLLVVTLYVLLDLRFAEL